MRIADYSVTKAVLERHGFTFKKSFGQNFSRIHDFLKDIGIRQEILSEGLFKGKTVTLQHCIGHAIICNSHLFSFLFIS